MSFISKETTIPSPVAGRLPTTPAEAINFALDHLEPFEVSEFLSEWREGKDLKPWLAALRADREGA